MTKEELKEELFEAIKLSGENGVCANDMAYQFYETTSAIWNAYNRLNKEGKVCAHKVGTVFRMYSIEHQKDVKELDMSNEMDLQNLGEAIAKLSANSILENIMPLVRQKCVEEFGMTPIVQKIKVGDLPEVEMKTELPPCFKRILSNVVRGNNVMMTGPAGTGKGTLARQVATAVGAEFYEVNAVKNEYGLTGFVDANSRFVRTPFYDACKAVTEGKKVVFLFDEMDCSDPEVLKIFNEALSSFEFTFPNDEKLSFKDLIVLAACNTYGTGADEAYCGQQLDASTLDRFAVIKVDYNRKVEMCIARGDEQLVDFIDAFRKQTEKQGLFAFVTSYRSIERIVNMNGSDVPLKDVMKDCFIKSMAEDDLKSILNNMRDEFSGNNYFQACEGKNVKFPISFSQQELELTA